MVSLSFCIINFFSIHGLIYSVVFWRYFFKSSVTSGCDLMINLYNANTQKDGKYLKSISTSFVMLQCAISITANHKNHFGAQQLLTQSAIECILEWIDDLYLFYHLGLCCGCSVDVVYLTAQCKMFCTSSAETWLSA